MLTFLSLCSQQTITRLICLFLRAADLFCLRCLAQRPEEARRFISSRWTKNRLHANRASEERQWFSTANQALKFSIRALLILIPNKISIFLPDFGWPCVWIRMCVFVKLLLQRQTWNVLMTWSSKKKPLDVLYKHIIFL